MVKQVNLVSREIEDRQDQQVRKVPLVNRVRLALLGQLVCKETKEVQDKQANLVLRVPEDSPAYKVALERLVSLVVWEL